MQLFCFLCNTINQTIVYNSINLLKILNMKTFVIGSGELEATIHYKDSGEVVNIENLNNLIDRHLVYQLHQNQQTGIDPRRFYDYVEAFGYDKAPKQISKDLYCESFEIIGDNYIQKRHNTYLVLKDPCGYLELREFFGEPAVMAILYDNGIPLKMIKERNLQILTKKPLKTNSENTHYAKGVYEILVNTSEYLTKKISEIGERRYDNKFGEVSQEAAETAFKNDSTPYHITYDIQFEVYRHQTKWTVKFYEDGDSFHIINKEPHITLVETGVETITDFISRYYGEGD